MIDITRRGQRNCKNLVAPDIRIQGDKRFRQPPSSPEPDAVDCKLSTPLASLIQRVLVQQHLNFIGQAAPEGIVCAEGQLVPDIPIYSFTE